MTAAILTIVGSLVGLIIWAIKRRAERKANPLDQHRERYQQIDRDIAEHNAASAAANGAADLDELDRLHRASARGPHASELQRAKNRPDAR